MYFYLCTLLSFTGWALAGSLSLSRSVSLSPRLTVCLSFVCFVEGAKLCSVWTGGSTRGEWTFPQAPGRAEQRVQEKCPWGESGTPPTPYTVSHIHTYDPPYIISTMCHFAHLHLSRYWLSASLQLLKPPHIPFWTGNYFSCKACISILYVNSAQHLREIRVSLLPSPFQ